uniref:Uncharacterized protein n=1 Tax=Rhizochromulina marina TaxID=1034831 RepID=A0A7S2S287_9STRA|mmetsp:Transcript_24064/g.70553  ORF Transcript_24064/g.70553 Transcript_24064/m.70553 type:complete len:162 (+) Transcript_24064:334-819(+)
MMTGGCAWDNKRRVCLPSTARFHPQVVLNRFTFVGITEHFHASLCLFYYTIKDHWRFDKYCGETGPASAPLPNLMDSSWVNLPPEVSQALELDGKLLRLAVDTNNLDFELYWAGYGEFKHRVAWMERAVGRTFLQKKSSSSSSRNQGAGKGIVATTRSSAR